MGTFEILPFWPLTKMWYVSEILYWHSFMINIQGELHWFYLSTTVVTVSSTQLVKLLDHVCDSARLWSSAWSCRPGYFNLDSTKLDQRAHPTTWECAVCLAEVLKTEMLGSLNFLFFFGNAVKRVFRGFLLLDLDHSFPNLPLQSSVML